MDLGQYTKSLAVVLAYCRKRVDLQDETSRVIKLCDDIGGVGGNDAVCYGREDVIHILFVFFNPLQYLLEIGEKAGIINGNSCLMAKGDHKIAVLIAEQVCVYSTIDIYRANAGFPYYERDAHDGADAKGYDPLLPLLFNLPVIIDYRPFPIYPPP